MGALLAFGAALLALRLAGALFERYRKRRAPELVTWTAALGSYAVACAALAWAAAAGWDGRVFRVYYLFGALLTAPLLGAGSLMLVRVHWIRDVIYVYVGIAVGVVLTLRLTHSVHGGDIPSARDHVDFFPARLLALIGNSLGTAAVVAVALLTIRDRLLGNVLIVTGVAVAGVGSALPQLGEAGTAAFLAAAVVLIYAGFVGPRLLTPARRERHTV